jgi:hypothetical protein
MHRSITIQKLKKLARYVLAITALVLTHAAQAEECDNHPPVAIYVTVRRDRRR